ncbi:MAG: hypothetical protein ACJ79R_22880 [Anaeromyxobacteraceae bacterium]
MTQRECWCEKASCGCAKATTGRRDCGDRCDCTSTCQHGAGCACISTK